MTTIAYLGPAGTFSHAAALALTGSGTDPGHGMDPIELVPADSVLLAMRSVADGSSHAAVVPMESSVEGGVPATLDQLANGDPLVIRDETYVQVSFDLLVRPGTSLAQVQRVASHPHAEAQVRGWLHANLPGMSVTMVDSTAAAAEAVARGEFDAAVSAPIAGRLYGLETAAHDIADNAGAVTRFVLLSRPVPPSAPTGNDKTTLVAYLRQDHSGALLELLTEFASRAVNLTRIESRPTKGRIGQYCFSIDCEGHVADERVGYALAALHRICADVRYLGSYPRRDGQQGPVPDGRRDGDFTAARDWLRAVRESGTS